LAVRETPLREFQNIYLMVQGRHITPEQFGAVLESATGWDVNLSARLNGKVLRPRKWRRWDTLESVKLKVRRLGRVRLSVDEQNGVITLGPN